MHGQAVRFGTALAVVAAIAAASAQPSPPQNVDRLVSAAKTAAGLDWPGTFLRLCVVPPPPAPTSSGRGAAGGPPPGPPAKDTWYAEPAKVADNLYFLGTKIDSAWALVGSDGIIILEGLFDYAAPDEIIGGMKKLNLDTRKVKYIVMSHAHADHDGGAQYLQESMPTAHLLYGGPDWDAVDKSTNHAGGKPKHDMVAADLMRLSVGDASIQIVTMPGHTPGTLSYLFEVKDNGKPLKIAYVGGTAIPFDRNAAYYDGYIASSRKMAKAAADFGATAILANHSEFDNAYYKARTAAARKPGDANPFDVGTRAVANYFTVVDACATAAKLRAAAGKSQAGAVSDPRNWPKDIDLDSTARVRKPKRDELDQDGKATYDLLASSSPRYTNGLPPPTAMLMNSPKMAKHIGPAYLYLRFGNAFGQRLTELAILVSARENDAQFQWTSHEPQAPGQGLEQEIIDIVKYRRSTAALSEKDALVIRFGHELIGQKKLTSETFAHALKVFGKEGVTDLAGLMAFYNFLYTVSNVTFDIQMPANQKPLLPIP